MTQLYRGTVCSRGVLTKLHWFYYDDGWAQLRINRCIASLMDFQRSLLSNSTSEDSLSRFVGNSDFSRDPGKRERESDCPRNVRELKHLDLFFAIWVFISARLSSTSVSHFVAIKQFSISWNIRKSKLYNFLSMKNLINVGIKENRDIWKCTNWIFARILLAKLFINDERYTKLKRAKIYI